MSDSSLRGASDTSSEAARSRVRVHSPTEQVNPNTVDIDLRSTEQALRLLNAEDSLVAPAVAAVLPELARVVDEAATRILAGGRVHYFGAGTSGRLAVLDAAELRPTFGLDDVVVAHHAGGSAALVEAVENAEDSADDGAAAARSVTSRDLAIGLTASGRTPYVAGALATARQAGAFTVLMTANPQAELGHAVDVLLAADTGPEALTGSTRLKAGTATKLMLNGFSTVLMMRLGRIYSNLMIDMRATNAKLRGRSVGLLVQATGAPLADCSAALAACGDIKTALVLLLSADSASGSAESAPGGDGVDGAPGGDGTGALPGMHPWDDASRIESCRAALEASGGRVRDALRAR